MLFNRPWNGLPFLWKRNQQFSNCDFTCQNRLKRKSEIKVVVEWTPMILSLFLRAFSKSKTNSCSLFTFFFRIRSYWKLQKSNEKLHIFRNGYDSFSIIPFIFGIIFINFIFIFTVQHILWAEMLTSIYSWMTQVDDSPILCQEIGHGNKLKLSSRQHIKSYLCQSSIIM